MSKFNSVIQSQLDLLKEEIDAITEKKDTKNLDAANEAMDHVETAEEQISHLRRAAYTLPKFQQGTLAEILDIYQRQVDQTKHALLVQRSDTSISVKQKVMDSEEKARDGLQKLQEARRQLYQTTGLATDTLILMKGQGDQIKKIKETTITIQAELSRSNGTIKKMDHWTRR